MTTPQQDDANPPGGRDDSVESRKPRRGRGRAPRKAKGEAAPAESGAVPEAPAQKDDSSRRTAVAPEQPPAPPPSPAPQPETPAIFVPPARPEANSEAGAAGGGSSEAGGQDYRPKPQAPAGNGGPYKQQSGGGGHGEWQDRNAWKRNKRKRGRFGGGNWQPAPGGGSQHPPQPPPPTPVQSYGDLPNPAKFADLGSLDQLATEISAGKSEPLRLDQLYALNLADLTAAARKLGVSFEGAPNRKQLLAEIFKEAAQSKRPIRDVGYVDLTDRAAFIVHEHVNYRLYPEDPYLPDSLIKRYGLKRGHKVQVLLQAPGEGERCPAVVRIDDVMGHEPEEIAKITPFEELIPYYPLQRILLEAPEVQKDVSMRAVDILTPIGFGQRGLIVAPPRTGKTVLLQNIANSISANSPEVKLILLLIDERPEEVTDFRRHTKGEVVSSTFDEAPESHVHCAEMVGEKARRLVENGEHVVILLDSITRLARAYNALASNAGKIMSGGLEATALQKPKRFFGAARNIEGAGSLTIVATALIDTGSRMDEVIFEEFKGTGNMELHLDRGLVERRIFPAINIDRSGTRKEELIYHPEELQRIYGLRRAMQGLGPIESMEMLIQRLKKTKSNAEFLLTLSRQ
jgi:transcription termination factor Rho